MIINRDSEPKRMEDRIQEYEDMEEEISREYFSGKISLRRKILATGYAEKKIASLKNKKEHI